MKEDEGKSDILTAVFVLGADICRNANRFVAPHILQSPIVCGKMI